MKSRLYDARTRLMEAWGRLQQASETRSDPVEEYYYLREASNRLAECLEAILNALEPEDD